MKSSIPCLSTYRAIQYVKLYDQNNGAVWVHKELRFFKPDHWVKSLWKGYKEILSQFCESLIELRWPKLKITKIPAFCLGRCAVRIVRGILLLLLNGEGLHGDGLGLTICRQV